MKSREELIQDYRRRSDVMQGGVDDCKEEIKRLQSLIVVQQRRCREYKNAIQHFQRKMRELEDTRPDRHDASASQAS